MCLRRCVGQAPPFLALKPCTSFRNAVHPPMSNCLLTFGGEGPKVSKNPPLFPPLQKSKNGCAPHANQPRSVFLSNRPLRKKVGARARQGGRILCLRQYLMVAPPFLVPTLSFTSTFSPTIKSRSCSKKELAVTPLKKRSARGRVGGGASCA